MERAATQNTLSRFQPVVRECRDMALTELTSRLGQMFDKSEQALLDFIDKADTNQGQFQFIDAISVVNSNRKAVEQDFREEIARGFSEFSNAHAISYPKPLLEQQQRATDTLELLDDNELDERLSLRNMIERAQSECFQQLYALRQRLSMVRGGQKLEDTDLPAGPIHAVSAFQTAAERFGFETNILLIVYALFDKFVIRDLNDFYKQLNEKLVAAGVFPNLKLEAPKNPNAPAAAAGGSDGEAQQHEEQAEGTDRPTAAAPSANRDIALGEEIFDSIRNLMASRRSQDPRYARHPEINPGAAPPGSAGKMVDTPTLVSAIDKIQSVESAPYLPDISDKNARPSRIEVDAALLDQVRERLIEERERLFQGVDRNTIPSADLDTIELVGMLFEHVLNEEELPNIAKALISHLHTPYLKVAILDHRFLIDSRHVARQLLNLMVESGLQWIEEEDLRRGIYYPMQEGVNRILAEFKDNLDIFHEVSDKLAKQVGELNQKAKIVEARAREAAKGRERLESARLRAHKIVQEIVGERRFHPIVERFLNHAWLDKMILMLLRDPMIESSPEWRQVVGTIDDIIAIYESRENRQLTSSLDRMLPALKQRIEEGLATVGDFHQPDLKALFDLLDSLAGGADAAELAATPVKKSVPQIRDKRTDEAVKSVENRQAGSLSTEEQAIVNSLKGVKFGTWFEVEDDNHNMHRLKLSWFSPITQKYMFVDKAGIQALVTPIERLARQMHNGRAKILKHPKLPFVDRALDSVLAVLQKTFGGSAAK